MIKRRDFLANSGAVAVVSLLTACGGETVETAITADIAETSMVDAVAVDADTDLINDFLAESFSEPDAIVGSVADTVTSLQDLADNPDLFAQVKNVIGEVANGTIKAAEMADEDAVDFAHLVTDETFGEAGAYDETVFNLTSDVMWAIAAANHYTIDVESHPTVLFGLRGCILGAGSSATGTSIEVREAKIDHLKRRCLVGTWDTATGELNVFEGSTVPNLVNMQLHLFWKYAQNPLNDAEWPFSRAALSNQLPQGLHEYAIGTHLRYASKRRRHPGAFLQRSASPVLRAQNDLSYSFAENWDPLDWRPNPAASDRGVRVTGNNIHAAVNKFFPGYASQGCQTIQGYYFPKGEKPVGAWSQFQAALGISMVEADGNFTSNLDDTDTRYKYMLSSGREARLHTLATEENAFSEALKRLRIGSNGPAVTALRAILNLSVESDQMDADVMNELLRWQSSRMPKDGVMSPRINAEHELGLEL